MGEPNTPLEPDRVPPVRIVTWNVNSLNARLGRVERWLQTFQPDVLCLQETKLADDAVPALAFEALGYETFHHGEGRWNGVAILSRVGIENPIAGFGDGEEPDRDARIAWATCGGVRIASCYVPNGRSLDDDHYQYKLQWLDRLQRDLDGQCDPGDDIVVCGDFNIAPDDRDVYDPSKFLDQTHTSAAEREKLAGLAQWGLVDVFREHHDDSGLFSWWDYRGWKLPQEDWNAHRSVAHVSVGGRHGRHGARRSQRTKGSEGRPTERSRPGPDRRIPLTRC